MDRVSCAIVDGLVRYETIAEAVAAYLLAAERDDPLMRSEVVWGVLGLTGALLVGAAVIYAVDKWRKRAAAGRDRCGRRRGQLTGFRAMFENGEITEAEYAGTAPPGRGAGEEATGSPRKRLPGR